MSTIGGAVGISSTTDQLTESTIKAIDQKSESSSKDPSTIVEKGEVIEVDNVEDDTLLLSHEEQFPIDPNEELETQQFTFRAVLVGCILGGVIAASKYVLYLLHRERMFTIYQCISWLENGLDVRCISFRFNFRLRHPQAPLEGPTKEFWGRLLRSQGKCLLSVRRICGWFPRLAVHIRFSSGLPAWFVR